MNDLKKYLSVILISSLVGAVGFLVWETRAELIFKEARQWQIAADDVTGDLMPTADGTDDSANFTDGTTACNATDCWDEVDEITGTECGSQSDGATTLITSSTANATQTFDIDISGIPDGNTITNINITVCAVKTAGAANYQTRKCINDGVCTSSGVDIVTGPTYAEGSQDHSVSITKTAGTSIEIGVQHITGGKVANYSRIDAVITHSGAPSLSFGIDSNSLDFGDLTPGTPIINKTSILTVTTNNVNGFNITASRDDSDTTLDLGTDDTVNITDQTDWNSSAPNSVLKANLDNSGDVLAFRVKYTGTDSSNYNSTWWGSDDGDGNALFAGFPTPGQTIVNRGSASDPSTDSVVQYYIDVPGPQKIGTYDGGVTYTATPN